MISHWNHRHQLGLLAHFQWYFFSLLPHYHHHHHQERLNFFLSSNSFIYSSIVSQSLNGKLFNCHCHNTYSVVPPSIKRCNKSLNERKNRSFFALFTMSRPPTTFPFSISLGFFLHFQLSFYVIDLFRLYAQRERRRRKLSFRKKVLLIVLLWFLVPLLIAFFSVAAVITENCWQFNRSSFQCFTIMSFPTPSLCYKLSGVVFWSGPFKQKKTKSWVRV